MNRQKKVLWSLFVMLLGSIGYAWWMMPVQQRVTTPATTQTVATSPRSGVVAPVGKNRLRIDLLEREPSRFSGARRDLFNFYVAPPPPPAPVTKKEPEIKPPPPVRPEPVVTPVVRKQLAQFTFLGYLIKEGQHTVFLSRGEDLFLVKEGETFGDDNQFRAVSITPQKMTINQAGDTRPIDIVLVEKEPLIPWLLGDDAAAAMPTTATQTPAAAPAPAPALAPAAPTAVPGRSVWKGTPRPGGPALQ